MDCVMEQDVADLIHLELEIDQTDNEEDYIFLLSKILKIENRWRMSSDHKEFYSLLLKKRMELGYQFGSEG